MFKSPIVDLPFQAPGCKKSALGLLRCPCWKLCWPLAALQSVRLRELHLQVLVDLLSLGGKAQADQSTQQEGSESHY